MMTDATRPEALQWCIDNMCDFRNPVFPPPNGWMWGESGEALILTAIFTSDCSDITSVDIGIIPFTLERRH